MPGGVELHAVTDHADHKRSAEAESLLSAPLIGHARPRLYLKHFRAVGNNLSTGREAPSMTQYRQLIKNRNLGKGGKNLLTELLLLKSQPTHIFF